MTDSSLIGPWIRRFLLEHMVAERNLSKNTQRAIATRSCCCSLRGRALKSRLIICCVEELSADVVRLFLQHLEECDRFGARPPGTSGLAASMRWPALSASIAPEHIDWCGQVRLVRSKNDRNRHPLSRQARDRGALSTAKGARGAGHADYAICSSFTTRGRVSAKPAALTIGDFDYPGLHTSSSFRKGIKDPLLPSLASHGGGLGA